MIHKLFNITAYLCFAIPFFTMLVNAVVFPDCNRQTRECFLVQHLWHDASGDTVEVARNGGVNE